MNKLKTMWIVWGIIAVLLFGCLTTMGFVYKNTTKKYKKIENKLVEVTKKYTSNEFEFATNGKKEIITYKQIKDNDYIGKLEVNNKKCDGYVILEFDGVTKYKAYIDCGKYKTHGFDKKYLEED